jgi:hypothetical protein
MPPALLVSAQFIWFVPVEPFLAACRAGTMPLPESLPPQPAALAGGTGPLGKRMLVVNPYRRRAGGSKAHR